MLKYLFIIVILIPLSISSIFAQNGAEKRLIAYVFLSDECPMCQGYAPVLNQLAANYESKGVELVGVFPNYYATDSAIGAFKKEYNITFKMRRDSGFILTNRLGASITPQVFVENTEGVLLYSGQIDDAYFRAGKRRGTTTFHYLKDAIDSLLINKKPTVEMTKAVGCVIVKD